MSTVKDDQVFAAIGAQLVGKGAVTLHEIVAQTGVSVGSLYHRYGSREGLLAQTWLDAVEAFQARFLEALESDRPDAGEQAALATPRFCRAETERAKILACCRQVEFISGDSPDDLKARIARVNDSLTAAIGRFAERSGHTLTACRLGLVAYPLAAVRHYLPDLQVPDEIDRYVAAAYYSAMDTGRLK